LPKRQKGNQKKRKKVVNVQRKAHLVLTDNGRRYEVLFPLSWRGGYSPEFVYQDDGTLGEGSLLYPNRASIARVVGDSKWDGEEIVLDMLGCDPRKFLHPESPYRGYKFLIREIENANPYGIFCDGECYYPGVMSTGEIRDHYNKALSGIQDFHPTINRRRAKR
jgi:hypothetical protein